MRLQSDKPNNDCPGVVWSLSYAYHDAPPYCVEYENADRTITHAVVPGDLSHIENKRF
jgi:hypothetical protein